MRRILIDTSAIFALAARNDKNHPAARGFLADWLEQEGGFVLPDVIFNGSMTLLKSRLGTQPAIQVGREMRRNPLCLWTPLEAGGERTLAGTGDRWAAFQQYDD